MSRESRRVAGVLLIMMPTISFGRTSIHFLLVVREYRVQPPTSSPRAAEGSALGLGI
jgi:hypothetical protein